MRRGRGDERDVRRGEGGCQDLLVISAEGGGGTGGCAVDQGFTAQYYSYYCSLQSCNSRDKCDN